MSAGMPPASATFTPPWLPICTRPAGEPTACVGDLWRSNMVPLLPVTVAAILWDQGEADAKRTNASWYRAAWPAMIRGWREGLRQPTVPFVYVELDGQMHDEVPHDVIDFWEAQRAAATTLPAVGFATTTDIQRGTHPPDKQDVANRLALEVRRIALGADIVSRGPELASSTVTGGYLTLKFSNASLVSGSGILVNSSCAVKNPPKWCGVVCGTVGADSLATDAETNLLLNYTLAKDTVTVDCAGASLVRINSDLADCFLYAANGSTATPDGLMLPAPPILVACNHSSAAALKADDEGAAVTVWVAGPMAKIFPSTLPALTNSVVALLEGARAQHAQFQIALRPPLGDSVLHTVTVVATALVGGGGRSDIISDVFSVRRVVCVNVSAPKNAQKNPDGGMLWPDALPFLSAADTFAPNTTSVLWITVAVPTDAAPGVYTGSVTVLAAQNVVVKVPVSLEVRNFSVAQRSLQTDSKLSEQWISRFRAREPDGGGNMTALVLNYYREMADHRVTMMGWGGVSIFPSIAANFSADFSTVSLDTAGYDAMATELEQLGIQQLHFPLPAACSCCEPITHIRVPIPQVIPQDAVWYLAAGFPTVSVFDSQLSTLEQPVLNSSFVKSFSVYVKAVSAHLTSKGWLHTGTAPAGALNANYMLFIDEVDITDPFTARALLLIDTFLKKLEPRLQIAQTRFPTNQYGSQNQSLVTAIEGVVDMVRHCLALCSHCLAWLIHCLYLVLPVGCIHRRVQQCGGDGPRPAAPGCAWSSAHLSV